MDLLDTYRKEYFTPERWLGFMQSEWVPVISGAFLPPLFYHPNYYVASRYEQQRSTRRFVHPSLPVWIGDTVTEHVRRVVWMSETLPRGLFDQKTVDAVSYALKVHDIHEQGEHDKTAVELLYLKRAEVASQDKAEQWLARHLLSANLTHRQR